MINNKYISLTISAALVTSLLACQPQEEIQPRNQQSDNALSGRTFQFDPNKDYYGTLEPFASEAVYFVMTDRFVNGDPNNDYSDQGGDYGSYDIPLPECDGVSANIGYLGGDFKGLLDNADYIHDMGFSAVWLTPIVQNPDQAFSGGGEISCDSILTDHGKAAYHGYWAVNFHEEDEHLISPDLHFAHLTSGLKAKGLKTVLDIVGNHSSPAWGMDETQAASSNFGKLYNANNELIADHNNLSPEQLNTDNPLQAMYNTEAGLAQLGDLNPDNPLVMEDLTQSYLKWIEQGADALRVDTIQFQPYSFWKTFSDKIRAQHPGFFMFAEAFNTNADEIAPYTWPENGGISVLDFPMRSKLAEIFEQDDSDYAVLLETLHLEDGLYANPYDLAIFYDNHDMARLNANDENFINAHNWLFTARGFPVVYYGSEMGFMRGRKEHAGNRNYFGTEGIATARQHIIYEHLKTVAYLRKTSIALQRGQQINIEFDGDKAAFYRVYQYQSTRDIALVLLNKGSQPKNFNITEPIVGGIWENRLTQEIYLTNNHALNIQVPANSLVVASPQ